MRALTITIADPRDLLRPVARIWFPIAAGLTILAGTAYAGVQQDLRQSANDPQIQIAEDAATALATGVQPESVTPTQHIDLGRGLTPFVMVFDANGRVLASSGSLNGATPVLPPGVLQRAAEHGQNRLTWQPQPGVREAAVIQSVTGAPQARYVLAARSLREVESRETNAQELFGLGWLGALAASLVATVLGVTLL
ncbi:MAG: hypothetical protein JO247_01245 [Chloroflexi bacterium]|nr:hypothetical protein [Chloroflexota bacterium]